MAYPKIVHDSLLSVGKDNGKDVTIWTAAETAIAITAASIPQLRVFFKDYTRSSSEDPTLNPINNPNKFHAPPPRKFTQSWALVTIDTDKGTTILRNVSVQA